MFSTSTLRSYFVLALALVLALPLALLLIAGKAGTLEDALAAREAVIRYQLTNSESALADGVDTFCVEIIDVADTAASSRSASGRGAVRRSVQMVLADDARLSTAGNCYCGSGWI